MTDTASALLCFRFVRTVPVLSEEQRAEFNTLEMAMRKEFISQQLIHLAGCLDTNEEGGRSVVEVLWVVVVVVGGRRGGGWRGSREGPVEN